MNRALAALAAWGFIVSASPLPQPDEAVILGETLPPKLSDFRLLSGRQGMTPNARVIPYTLNTPLFSDYAEKFRFIYVPRGKAIAFASGGVPQFPTGTVLIKSFGYPADYRQPDNDVRIRETRLLIKRPGGWIALPYIWNADGSEATLQRAGKRIDVSWIHTDGSRRAISYAVPNVNQCKGCHDDGAGGLAPIGPKARNMSGAQMEHWRKSGILKGFASGYRALPRWDDPAAPVEARARAYLDVNCGHCHNPKGPANTSGLWLNWEQPADTNLGLYKRPTAAGRGSGDNEFAIAPGHPDKSILTYRMKSLDPGIAMPELGRATVHEEGVALLDRWIAEMK